MSDQDVVDDAIERLEWDERKEEELRSSAAAAHAPYRADRWRGWNRGADPRGVRGSSSSSSSTARPPAAGAAPRVIFGVSKAYKFTFVNHVTTKPFFTPTQNGAAGRVQAARVLLPVDRLGDEQRRRDGQRDEQRRQRRRRRDRRLADRPDGVQLAGRQSAGAKIPVVAYNADAAGNARLAYIGQDLFVSGQEMGTHIASARAIGRRRVVHRRRAPLNIQPRIDGARQTLKTHPYDQDARGRDRAAVPAS